MNVLYVLMIYLLGIAVLLAFDVNGISLSPAITGNISNLPESEINALKGLYYALNGQHWFWRELEIVYGKPWNVTSPNPFPCLDQWQGLRCSQGCQILNSTIENHLKDGCTVTAIYLGAYNLQGTIPSVISNLANIRTIDFKDNRISGSLPAELFTITALVELYLSVNQINQTFPVGFFPTNVSILDLNENNIYGSIPSTISSWQALRALDIGTNFLTGTIPTEFGLLSALYQLFVQFNHLSGSLPIELFSLGNMTYFSVEFNSLSGIIPEISQLSSLKSFMLSGNQFSGTADGIEFLTKSPIYALGLGRNLFTGRIPFSTNSLALVYLDYSENYFSGSLPDYIGIYQHLEQFLMYGNYISSTLPVQLSNLTAMWTILLQGNMLSGSLADAFSFSERLVKLTTIDLSDNRLTGELIDKMFTLPLINSISLTKNCFHGTIPSSICNSSFTLSSLDLDGLTSGSGCQQRINGNVFDVFKFSSFYAKRFMAGSIPPCLLTTRRLHVIHLSGNGLTGTIPELVDDYLLLRNLSLSYNRLTGTIPISIQTHPFKSLDLSYNRLSGSTDDMNQLPLSSNPSINATVLTLQVNRLSGILPSNFHDALHINVVTGNLFGCKGSIEGLPEHDPGSSKTTCGTANANQIMIAGSALILFSLLCLVMYIAIGAGIGVWLLASIRYLCGESAPQLWVCICCSCCGLLSSHRHRQQQRQQQGTNTGIQQQTSSIQLKQVTRTALSDELIEQQTTENSQTHSTSHSASTPTTINNATIKPFFLVTCCNTIITTIQQLPQQIDSIISIIKKGPLVRYYLLSEEIRRHGQSEKMSETRIFLLILVEFRRMFLAIGLLIVFINLPSYLALRYTGYSTHTFLYGWKPSGMFFEGSIPTIVILILSILSSILTLVFIYRIDSKEIGENSLQRQKSFHLSQMSTFWSFFANFTSNQQKADNNSRNNNTNINNNNNNNSNQKYNKKSKQQKQNRIRSNNYMNDNSSDKDRIVSSTLSVSNQHSNVLYQRPSFIYSLEQQSSTTNLMLGIDHMFSQEQLKDFELRESGYSLATSDALMLPVDASRSRQFSTESDVSNRYSVYDLSKSSDNNDNKSQLTNITSEFPNPTTAIANSNSNSDECNEFPTRQNNNNYHVSSNSNSNSDSNNNSNSNSNNTNNNSLTDSKGKDSNEKSKTMNNANATAHANATDSSRVISGRVMFALNSDFDGLKDTNSNSNSNSNSTSNSNNNSNTIAETVISESNKSQQNQSKQTITSRVCRQVTDSFQNCSQFFLKLLSRKRRAKYAIYIVVPLFNALVVTLFNGLYLYFILTYSSTFDFIAQSLLLVFKLLWNVVFIPTVLRSLRADKSMFVRKLALQTLMLLFNIIVAPVLATMLASPNCFYNAFSGTEAITVNSRYEVCYLYLSDGICLVEITFPLSTSFIPPFLYSYQCSSAVLQNYVPVFLEMYAVVIVAYPIMIVLLSIVVHRYTHVKEPRDTMRASRASSIDPNAVTDSEHRSNSVFATGFSISAFLRQSTLFPTENPLILSDNQKQRNLSKDIASSSSSSSSPTMPSNDDLEQQQEQSQSTWRGSAGQPSFAIGMQSERLLQVNYWAHETFWKILNFLVNAQILPGLLLTPNVWQQVQFAETIRIQRKQRRLLDSQQQKQAQLQQQQQQQQPQQHQSGTIRSPLIEPAGAAVGAIPSIPADHRIVLDSSRSRTEDAPQTERNYRNSSEEEEDSDDDRSEGSDTSVELETSNKFSAAVFHNKPNELLDAYETGIIRSQYSDSNLPLHFSPITGMPSYISSSTSSLGTDRSTDPHNKWMISKQGALSSLDSSKQIDASSAVVHVDSNTVSKVDTASVDNVVAITTKGKNTNYSIINSIAEKRNKLLNPGIIISHIVTHFAVLVTFGAMYPPLACFIVIAAIVITLQWQILVGRYLRKLNEECVSNATHILLIARLERSCHGVRRRLFHRTKWIILLLKSLFFVLFAYDMTASKAQNVTDFVWAPVSFIVYPFLMFIVLELYVFRAEFYDILSQAFRYICRCFA